MSDEIEINERWTIEPDSKCFVLHEHYESEGKDGTVSERTNDTYHRNVSQCLRKIIESDFKTCSTVEEFDEEIERLYELVEEVKDCE